MATRSANVLFSLEDLKFSTCDPINFKKGLMLPPKKFVMDRFYSSREKELKLRGKYRGLRQTVISELAHELQEA